MVPCIRWRRREKGARSAARRPTRLPRAGSAARPAEARGVAGGAHWGCRRGTWGCNSAPAYALLVGCTCRTVGQGSRCVRAMREVPCMTSCGRSPLNTPPTPLPLACSPRSPLTHPHAPPTSHPRERARRCRPPARPTTSRGAAAAAVAAAARRAPSRRRAGAAGWARGAAGWARGAAGWARGAAGWARKAAGWARGVAGWSAHPLLELLLLRVLGGEGLELDERMALRTAVCGGVRRRAACGVRRAERGYTAERKQGMQRRGAEDAEGAECSAWRGCRAGVRRRARRARRVPRPGAEGAEGAQLACPTRCTLAP